MAKKVSDSQVAGIKAHAEAKQPFITMHKLRSVF